VRKDEESEGVDITLSGEHFIDRVSRVYVLHTVLIPRSVS